MAPAGKVLRPQLGAGAPSVLPAHRAQDGARGGGGSRGLHTPLPPAGRSGEDLRVLPRLPSPLLLPSPPQGLRKAGCKGPQAPSPLAVEIEKGSWVRGQLQDSAPCTRLPLRGPSASEGPALTPPLAQLSFSLWRLRWRVAATGASQRLPALAPDRAECASVLPLTAV